MHPVAVIFAVMAGGQLFGFIGVLVALPVSAVLAVALRNAKTQWLRSPLYHGGAVPIVPEAEAAPEPAPAPTDDARSEERRGGKEGVRTCRIRWSQLL